MAFDSSLASLMASVLLQRSAFPFSLLACGQFASLRIPRRPLHDVIEWYYSGLMKLLTVAYLSLYPVPAPIE